MCGIVGIYSNKDIAKELGVSIATVSRVVNGNKNVNKEGILPGFEKSSKPKVSKAEAKLAKIKALNVSLKLIKPNDTV